MCRFIFIFFYHFRVQKGVWFEIYLVYNKDIKPMLYYNRTKMDIFVGGTACQFWDCLIYYKMYSLRELYLFVSIECRGDINIAVRKRVFIF